MLVDLSIQNFAIIDRLKVTFSRGLNIVSGETGAGKSIIINAVNLILGDRAVQAARESKPPKRVLALLESATRYPEGTAVRLEFKSAKAIATISRLAEIKLAH